LEIDMKLTTAQIHEYNERGFIVLQGLIKQGELDVLKSELVSLVSEEREGIVKEKSGAVRTVFRVHDMEGPTGLPSYAALTRIPRVLEPVKQIVEDDEVYIYHTKCNLKEAVEGEIWQWHQDFGYWQTDGVQDPEGMITALLMLSEATEIGGCLYFIPGSHKQGHIKPTLDETTTSYKLWTVPKKDVIDLMEKHGDPVPIVGKPGTVVLFHPHIVHGSGHNMSRYSRWHIYAVYNRVRNKPLPVENPRPQWVVSRDYRPLEAAADDDIAAGAPISVA
jgi:ectoine hydroxylase